MSLSRRELEDLKPMVDKTVQKFLGFSEPTLVTAAVNCIDNGYDKRKTIDKLGSILDDKQALTFADKLFSLYENFQHMSRHDRNKKRKEDYDDVGVTKPKKAKRFDDTTAAAPAVNFPVVNFPDVAIPSPEVPSPGQLTTNKIKEMMANAQKLILQRKAELSMVAPAPEKLPPLVPPTMSQQQVLMNDAMDKAKKAADLQARIQNQLANAGLPTMHVQVPPPIQMAGLGYAGAAAKAPSYKPAPLILDDEGRTIDAATGESVTLSHHMPTLKANIRAKRREEFKATIQERVPEEVQEATFFDARLSARNNMRSRRGFFKFHEQGKFEHLAQRMRTKAQLEKLQSDIAQAAKKTGIASATKLATIQPNKELQDDEVPETEWWDAVVLKNGTYETLQELAKTDKSRVEGVTNLVEHPIQMKPPAEPDKEVQISVMLTKGERKKLRRQNRTENQKEIQEKIRMGLMPPPEPKVRMANLMRVLGTEAVQDPTKIEAHVRAQMAKRVTEHEEANASRKLTKEERKEKKIKKIKEDVSLGVNVSVYRVTDLSNPSKKFKVETNANQLFMTGIVVLHKDCNVIAVEGGPKQQKKYRRLMLHRIKWEEDNQKRKRRDDDDDDEGKNPINKCSLVWEGMVQTRAFGEMKFKMCPTETFAREQFRKCSVEHYWDLAYSNSILEAAGEDD